MKFKTFDLSNNYLHLHYTIHANLLNSVAALALLVSFTEAAKLNQRSDAPKEGNPDDIEYLLFTRYCSVFIRLL